MERNLFYQLPGGVVELDYALAQQRSSEIPQSRTEPSLLGHTRNSELATLELQLLKALGFQEGKRLIRLDRRSQEIGTYFAEYSGLAFLEGGTAQTPYLLDSLAARSWYLGEQTGDSGADVPESGVDFVCLFSVLPGLAHPRGFNLLREATQVLRPKGCLLASFLEPGIPIHWNQFMEAAEAPAGKPSASHFHTKETLALWARHLKLQIEAIHAGDSALLAWDALSPLPSIPDALKLGYLGQSLVVLRKESI